MTGHPFRSLSWVRAVLLRYRALILAFVVGGAALAAWMADWHLPGEASGNIAVSSQSRRTGYFYPTAAQWATMTVETVKQHGFRAEVVTEGKIAIDEDRVTPIFSPYAGRVTKLLVKQGDVVVRGQLLFTVEATDMVQAQNEFIARVHRLEQVALGAQPRADRR